MAELSGLIPDIWGRQIEDMLRMKPIGWYSSFGYKAHETPPPRKRNRRRARQKAKRR